MRMKPLHTAATAATRTGEQKLATLTPGQRSEFEAKARTLGLEAISLAGEDHESAARLIDARNQLSTRQATLGKEMQEQILRERGQTIARLQAILKQMNEAHARELAKAQR
jgi:hypothetical protein